MEEMVILIFCSKLLELSYHNKTEVSANYCGQKQQYMQDKRSPALLTETLI